jgi:hypothetical protein
MPDEEKSIKFVRLVECLTYLGMIANEDDVNDIVSVNFGPTEAEVVRWLADEKGILIGFNNQPHHIKTVFKYDREPDDEYQNPEE